jgi:hypothetical protein
MVSFSIGKIKTSLNLFPSSNPNRTKMEEVELEETVT